MRNVLCQSLTAHAADPNFVFLTGDLGFRALEPLQAAAGSLGGSGRMEKRNQPHAHF